MPHERPALLAVAALLAASLTAVGGSTAAPAAARAAEPRDLQAGCPDGLVEPAAFDDVEGSAHRRAIDCVAHWEVALGRSSTRYAPDETVDRAQMASFVARAVVRTGGSLPEPGSDRFSDDDASVHEPAIDQLAEAGVVEGTAPGRYSPERQVTRAQMAALLVRAFDLRAHQAGQEPLPPGPDAFPDDDASPLEDAINAAAAAGLVAGYPDGTYRPGGSVEREAMASFLARWLDLAVSRGFAEVPPPPAVRVVAVGDLACRPGSAVTEATCQHGRTADLAEQLDPAAVLLLGDIQYQSGTVEEFTGEGGYTGTWSRLHDRSWPTSGNHEWETPGAEGYRRVFDDRTGGRDFYSFELGGWHVVSLNSSCEHVGGCGEGSPVHRFLLDDLAAHDGTPTLVFWHRPQWSTGRGGVSTTMSDLWTVAASDRDVQLALASHDHSYERFGPLDAAGNPTADGLPSIVVGTGGKSLYCDRTTGGPSSEVFDCSSFGVLELSLRSDGYDWRFAAATGSFTDSGSRGLRP